MNYFNKYMMKGVDGVLTNSHVCEIYKNFTLNKNYMLQNNFSVSLYATGNASTRRTMKRSCPSRSMYHRSRAMGGY
jgi:hypothetical protein